MYFPVLSLIVFSGSYALALPVTSNSTDVTTSAGIAQGAKCSTSDARAFLSIPFAIPPVGDLRFTSPQPYGKYPNGTLDATKSAPACIQFSTVFAESESASEDCLYLDVWVPSNAKKDSKFPVKVWIYGGSDESGGISNPEYDGCNIANCDALLVSINYRVGPLGFMALESAGIGGNFGIQDILLGLQWIRDNIASFGGDPKKVVLFGQSAGATDVFIVSTLPQAPSLIRAAISESGGGAQIANKDVLESLGANFAQSLNCSVSDIGCLRSTPISDLISNNPSLHTSAIYSGVNAGEFQPYIDGTTIPVQPADVATKVPTIFGSNSNEGQLFTLGDFDNPATITAENYTTYLQENFGPAASAVAQKYPISLFNSSEFPAFTAISTLNTDVSYKCSAYRGLKKASKAGVDVWTYLFSHTPSCPWFQFLAEIPPEGLSLIGATHTAEIPFVFGNLVNSPLPNGTCNFTARERVISNNLMAAWTSMAEFGQPSPPGGLHWPAWDPVRSLGMNVGNETVAGKVDYSMCGFWDELEASVLNFTVVSRRGRYG